MYNFNMNYLIIDIETTGLSAKQHSIVEIGALLTDENYNIIDIFETYVYAPYVPPFITNFNGIKASHLVNAPKIDQALRDLVKFAQEAVPIAHNSRFDQGFIRHYLEITNTPYIKTEWIDTIPLFKSKFPGMKNYKLDTLIKHFNLAAKEDHRALSDAKHTLTLLKI